jgi:hypothetical protein
VTLEQLATPIAVVVAGVIVAVALVYTRSSAPVPAPVSAPAVVAEPAAPRFVPTETPEIRERAVMNTRRELEAWRGEFVAKCWAPSAAATAEPRRIPLTFNVAFTPAGELVGLGIIEDGEVFRSDVANCMRGMAIAPKIPPPGVPLNLEVPFELP